ncbi:Folylpolyglutamate synthetase [Penicillium argentinense]|uniref:tetrahydrofolate synthase n=1 Tax=Penicillium argentinense TaxID=1131581 RepID=A0A9W9G1M2_9EURO|nr:Folylpolyglutamate synthetase [Penicillium argentinense]KAJ5109955.1 Folylpolyglutamate synthetase [Penicillium argentinense]
MRQWVCRIGYNVNDLNRLNVVHVAGTKGKGTTCAFVNSILQNYQQSVGVPRKIGLYTSPHLVMVRERIRINSFPISEEQFTKYFFEVWDALESSAVREGIDPAHKPAYFRFLTLMAFHVFMREGVDAAVFEVGVGGEVDSTNVIPQPSVTGITTLGIDHMAALGDTIDKIAWHKAGIFKTGSPAFTVPQVPDAMEVLHQRAKEKGINLVTIAVHPAVFDIGLKPAEDFQRTNASLAIRLSLSLLNKLGVQVDLGLETLPKQFTQGLENIVWRGRCEALTTEKQIWHLDGAHTEESLKLAASWFGRVSKSQSNRSRDTPRVLIFNQQSTRDAEALLRTVHSEIYNNCNLNFQYALFCTNVTYKGNAYKVDFVNRNVDPKELESLSLQRRMAELWHQFDPRTETKELVSIEEAIEYANDIVCEVDKTMILVTGSFHLVGGALSVLEGESFALQKATAQ